LREQCTPEVIERRRALEQAVLASAADFAVENTDHSHITPARHGDPVAGAEARGGKGDRPSRTRLAETTQPAEAGAAEAGATAAGPHRARNIALFVMVVIVAFALGVLVRLR
jgi:hypothetical protein